MIRLLSLPGMQSLENALILGLPPKNPDEPSVPERIDMVSQQLFGITELDTYVAIPESDSEAEWAAYDKRWDEREALFPDEAWDHPNTVAFYRTCGWDVTDDFGQVARVLEHFHSQIVLAEAGVMGVKPTSSVTAWATKLGEDAEKFAKPRKSQPWVPYRRERR